MLKPIQTYAKYEEKKLSVNNGEKWTKMAQNKWTVWNEEMRKDAGARKPFGIANKWAILLVAEVVFEDWRSVIYIIGQVTASAADTFTLYQTITINLLTIVVYGPDMGNDKQKDSSQYSEQR